VIKVETLRLNLVYEKEFFRCCLFTPLNTTIAAHVADTVHRANAMALQAKVQP
jgi:hypothetical protein